MQITNPCCPGCLGKDSSTDHSTGEVPRERHTYCLRATGLQPGIRGRGAARRLLVRKAETPVAGRRENLPYPSSCNRECWELRVALMGTGCWFEGRFPES